MLRVAVLLQVGLHLANYLPWPGTHSVRPVWLCYEFDLAVDIEPINSSPAFRNSQVWRAINPTSKVPAMTDGDMPMLESGTMIDYILERFGDIN